MVSVPSTQALPTCSRCGAQGQSLTRLTTRSGNRNGNAGRPYLKCVPCQQFVTFDDTRGITSMRNPCDCMVPSRLQVAGKAKGRGLHFVCANGACGFYAPGIDDSTGDQVKLPEDLIGSFAKLGFI